MTPATPTLKTESRGEHALDALLEELQTFAKPPPNLTSSANKPGEFSERIKIYSRLTVSVNTVPPPRSSSRIKEKAQELMILSSLTASVIASARQAGVMRSNSIPASAADIQQIILNQERPKSTPPPLNALIDETLDRLTAEEKNSNTSLASVDSQNGIINRSRQQILEERHQELLRKQRLLQQQYSKLQMLSRGQIPLPDSLLNDLKKTGSESNIMSKSGCPPALGSGSLTQLIPHLKLQQQQMQKHQLSPDVINGNVMRLQVNGKGSPSSPKRSPVSTTVSSNSINNNQNSGKSLIQTQKIYETDIL